MTTRYGIATGGIAFGRDAYTVFRNVDAITSEPGIPCGHRDVTEPTEVVTLAASSVKYRTIIARGQRIEHHTRERVRKWLIMTSIEKVAAGSDHRFVVSRIVRLALLR